MKIRDLKKHFQQELKEVYSERESESLFFIFLEERARMSRLTYISQSDAVFNESSWPRVNIEIMELKSGKPYQHVLGSVNFAGLRLQVSSKALIPRPETEEMIIRLQQHLQSQPQSVLDIGTGTGALALALKRFYPQAYVEAWDLSDDALELAAENAKEYSLDIELKKTDFLDNSQWGEQSFDLIISNPPYIAESEKESMENVVLKYDPHLALFAPGDDALIFYRKIAEFSKERLKQGGTVMVECNRNSAEEVKEIFEAADLKSQMLVDSYDNPRYVVGTK